MLQATSPKDLSLAARAAARYLQELGIELPHAKALDLAARMSGAVNHMTAVAALAPNAPTGVFAPRDLNSYADLRDALCRLTPAQLKMSITVSEGCDTNGDAEFFCATQFLLAHDPLLWGGADGVLEPEQPVLLFNQAVPAHEGTEPDSNDEDTWLLYSQEHDSYWSVNHNWALEPKFAMKFSAEQASRPYPGGIWVQANTVKA